MQQNPRLSTLVVDDEPLALKLLAAILREHPAIEVVAECRNAHEALDAILRYRPELAFLDIRMPGMSGFELVQQVQPELLPMVVFCTAHEQFAIDAFEVYAVDYVLKPIDADRVDLAVRRALDRRDGVSRGASEKARLIGTIRSLSDASGPEPAPLPPTPTAVATVAGERKIAMRDGDGYVVFRESDIDWIDAAGDYMCVHVQGITRVLRSTMKHLQEELDPTVFKRVHRSTIANMNRVEQLTPLSKGDYLLQLKGGEKIRVSRNYRDAIQAFLSEHQID